MDVRQPLGGRFRLRKLQLHPETEEDSSFKAEALQILQALQAQVGE
jgi:hypothetical protein